MPQDSSTSLHTYYRAFASLSGFFAAAIALIPMIPRAYLPGAIRSYGFPPLGNAEGLARTGTMIFALSTTYLAFFARSRRQNGNRARVVLGLAVALLSFFLYLGLSLRFVRSIEIPSATTDVQVSVGFTRTEFAKANFPESSDWELLRERGPQEEQVWKLWTPASIICTRLGLYSSYSLSLLSLIAAFSWGLLDQAENINRNKNPTSSRT